MGRDHEVADDTVRILVVEHDADVADYVVDVLRFRGWEVVGPAHTLAAALEKVSRADFDAAVLDLRLEPGEISFPLATLLRRRNIPFVFITGGIEGHNPMGFADVPVLRKPFQLEALISAVQGVLGPRCSMRSCVQ